MSPKPDCTMRTRVVPPSAVMKKSQSRRVPGPKSSAELQQTRCPGSQAETWMLQVISGLNENVTVLPTPMPCVDASGGNQLLMPAASVSAFQTASGGAAMSTASSRVRLGFSSLLMFFSP
jgi:hypothetical protein